MTPTRTRIQDLEHEVAELRGEIAALRFALASRATLDCDCAANAVCMNTACPRALKVTCSAFESWTYPYQESP